MEQAECFDLFLTEDDLVESDRSTLEVEIVEKDEVLDKNFGTSKLLKPAFNAILGKISGIIPDNFEISEVKLNIKVQGSFFGQSLSGNIDVKLSHLKE